MEGTKRRSPVVAFLLSILIPGLGQLYCGKPARGAVIFAGLCGILTLLGLADLFESWHGGFATMVLTWLVQLAGAVDALFCARRQGEISLQWYNKWYVYVAVSIIVLLGGYYVLRPLVMHKVMRLRLFTQSAGSMEPSLMSGDHFVVRLQSYQDRNPARGEVIVFLYPEDKSKFFVKRVVGVGGEKVAIKNKKVFINDKPLDEPYAVHRDTRTFPLGSMPRDNYGPLEVPAKSVFVMGDNRDHSNDSRFWGCVENRDIIGRARFIYWSKDRSRIRTEIESSPQAAKTK